MAETSKLLTIPVHPPSSLDLSDIDNLSDPGVYPTPSSLASLDSPDKTITGISARPRERRDSGVIVSPEGVVVTPTTDSQTLHGRVEEQMYGEPPIARMTVEGLQRAGNTSVMSDDTDMLTDAPSQLVQRLQGRTPDVYSDNSESTTALLGDMDSVSARDLDTESDISLGLPYSTTGSTTTLMSEASDSTAYLCLPEHVQGLVSSTESLSKFVLPSDLTGTNPEELAAYTASLATQVVSDSTTPQTLHTGAITTHTAQTRYLPSDSSSHPNGNTREELPPHTASITVNSLSETPVGQTVLKEALYATEFLSPDQIAEVLGRTKPGEIQEVVEADSAALREALGLQAVTTPAPFDPSQTSMTMSQARIGEASDGGTITTLTFTQSASRSYQVTERVQPSETTSYLESSVVQPTQADSHTVSRSLASPAQHAAQPLSLTPARSDGDLDKYGSPMTYGERDTPRTFSVHTPSSQVNILLYATLNVKKTLS